MFWNARSKTWHRSKGLEHLQASKPGSSTFDLGTPCTFGYFFTQLQLEPINWPPTFLTSHGTHLSLTYFYFYLFCFLLLHITLSLYPSHSHNVCSLLSSSSCTHRHRGGWSTTAVDCIVEGRSRMEAAEGGCGGDRCSLGGQSSSGGGLWGRRTSRRAMWLRR